MAHFNFENMINEVTRMDAPLQKAQMMRWQRKAMEKGVNQLQLPTPCNSPRSKSANSSDRTPITPLTISFNKSTPSLTGSTKTPGKSKEKPKEKGKTPNKKTPTRTQDRFIPNRSTTDLDVSSFLMSNVENEDPSNLTNPEYQQRVREALGKGSNPQDAKILSFKTKVPKTHEGYYNKLRVLYSGSCSVPKSASTRQIPQQPDRILDAPELIDDYYLNLLDWSANNHLAVSLGAAVYVWNASSGDTAELFHMEGQDEYVSSVKWIKEGNILAVGTSTGTVQLWDVGENKQLRSMTGHSARVGSLSWNTYILSSGSRSGAIHHHDVRVANHHVASLNHHTQEVCGLAWSPDGKYLASGGNDNLLNIWDPTMGEEVEPVHTFNHHLAAVKALAWCPFNPCILASGGGTADRNIRFWNISSGNCVNSVDTGSQVCSLLWSTEHKELLSAHGFSRNQLTIWKYPAMTKVTELTGHTARIVTACMSPDGSTVASAAADETIRLWKCFAVDKQAKKSVKKLATDAPKSSLNKGIR